MSSESPQSDEFGPLWPEGKAFGELDPAEKYAAMRRAASALSAEFAGARFPSGLERILLMTDEDAPPPEFLLDPDGVDGPPAGIDIECCPGVWVPYPTAGNTTECPECHSVFALIGDAG